MCSREFYLSGAIPNTAELGMVPEDKVANMWIAAMNLRATESSCTYMMW